MKERIIKRKNYHLVLSVVVYKRKHKTVQLALGGIRIEQNERQLALEWSEPKFINDQHLDAQ